MSSRHNFWMWRPCKSVRPLWAEWSSCSRVWTELSVRNTELSVALAVCNIWMPLGESGKLQMCREKKGSQWFMFYLSSFLCSLRSKWHGMLIVAAFIQHVILKDKQNDSRLSELALKHCNLHLNVSKNESLSSLSWRLMSPVVSLSHLLATAFFRKHKCCRIQASNWERIQKTNWLQARGTYYDFQSWGIEDSEIQFNNHTKMFW